MRTKTIGTVHGRFQPIHLGHMEYLLAAKKRCDHLLVGITNPDVTLTADHIANLARSTSKSNPFTYYERFLMIKGSLIEAGIDQTSFDILPFPINFPQLILNYFPTDATFYTTLYEKWNYVKVDILKSLGVRVEVLWERNMADRLTTGTEIRNLIATGNKYEHLVPPTVSKIIKELRLENRYIG